MVTLLRKYRAARGPVVWTYWMQILSAQERRRPRPEHVRAHAAALGQDRLILQPSRLPGFGRYRVQWFFDAGRRARFEMTVRRT